jgi:hypothetical protein
MLYNTLSTASQAKGLIHITLALLYSTLNTAAQSPGVNITLATMLYSAFTTASQAKGLIQLPWSCCTEHLAHAEQRAKGLYYHGPYVQYI